MKRFTSFLMITLISTSFYFSGAVYADISSIVNGGTLFKTPLFEASAAGAPLSSTVSFDYQPPGDQSSLGTCAMNPMSRARAEALMEELPLIQEEMPVTSVSDVAQAALSRLPPPVNTTTPPHNDPWRRPQEDVPPPPTASVPEPAALLTLLVGFTGLFPLTRRRHGG